MDTLKRLRVLSKKYPVLHWLGAVDEAHYMNMVDELRKIVWNTKGPRKVILHISNEGGDLMVAWAFYDFIRFSGLHLITVATSCVESAAVTLYLAGKTRCASRFSSFLLHDPQFKSDDGAFSRRTLQHAEKYTLLMHSKYLTVLSFASGLPKEEIDRLSEQATRLNAEEAKTLGIVHHIF